MIKYLQKILIIFRITKRSLTYNILKSLFLFVENFLFNIYIFFKKIRFYFSDYVRVKKFSSYELYIENQLKKTSNQNLRRGWLEKNNYNKKTKAFIVFFNKNKNILKKSKQTLAIGARTGNEVLAIRSFGCNCVGVDIFPYKDLVLKGDMHDLPFKDKQFDFIFTNVLDHSLYPRKFFREAHRVLKKNGYLLIHMLVDFDNDEYSVTNITNINQMKKLAIDFNVVSIINTDHKSFSFFHFNKEFLFRKK